MKPFFVVFFLNYQHWHICSDTTKWDILLQKTSCLSRRPSQRVPQEEIGRTEPDRKGLGSSTAKLWSKAEGKQRRDMVINKIQLNEDSRWAQKAVQQPQQGQWTNWDNALQKSLTWRHFGSAFSSYQCTISCL